MKITNIYFRDIEYKICKIEGIGLVILYNYKDEYPETWLEHQMKIMAWTIMDKRAEFGEPNRINGYWYVPIFLNKKRVRYPSFRLRL